jgi:hypothetical protein
MEKSITETFKLEIVIDLLFTETSAVIEASY